MTAQTKNSIRIALLFALLLIPNIFALCLSIDLEYSLLRKLIYLAVVVILLLVPAIFLKARTYFIVEGVFNFFFFPIDIASLYLNRQSTSSAFLLNILHTDIHEATELLLSIWPLCLIVVALWVLYFVLTFRIENTYFLSSFSRKIIGIATLALCIGGVVAMIVFQLHTFRSKPVKKVVIDSFDLAAMKLYKIYPYNLYLDLTDIIHKHCQQQRLQQEVASFRFGLQPSTSEPPALYVLVIGEAARYDHFGLNGYYRETTPLLSKQANIISYERAYSQANLTSYSVPLILTRATTDNPARAYKEKSLPEAFQEAGFQSGFLAKQVPTNLVSRIMQACNYRAYNAKSIEADNNYDEDLVSQLRQYTTDSLQFFVLHSLGCHFRYEQRYPAAFEQYKPVLGTHFSYSMISEDNKELFINAYDNAILYTDHFLSSLIQYMDSLNRPAVMLYMSDHGESFWDDERQLSLHGSYRISEYEYHVPLLVWYSEEYEAVYPAKVQALKQNKTTPVSSDVVFYSMLDLAGIEGGVTDTTRSLCSPALLPYDTLFVHTGSGATEPFVIR